MDKVPLDCLTAPQAPEILSEQPNSAALNPLKELSAHKSLKRRVYNQGSSDQSHCSWQISVEPFAYQEQGYLQREESSWTGQIPPCTPHPRTREVTSSLHSDSSFDSHSTKGASPRATSPYLHSEDANAVHGVLQQLQKVLFCASGHPDLDSRAEPYTLTTRCTPLTSYSYSQEATGSTGYASSQVPARLFSRHKSAVQAAAAAIYPDLLHSHTNTAGRVAALLSSPSTFTTYSYHPSNSQHSNSSSYSYSCSSNITNTLCSGFSCASSSSPLHSGANRQLGPGPLERVIMSQLERPSSPSAESHAAHVIPSSNSNGPVHHNNSSSGISSSTAAFLTLSGFPQSSPLAEAVARACSPQLQQQQQKQQLGSGLRGSGLGTEGETCSLAIDTHHVLSSGYSSGGDVVPQQHPSSTAAATAVGGGGGGGAGAEASLRHMFPQQQHQQQVLEHEEGVLQGEQGHQQQQQQWMLVEEQQQQQQDAADTPEDGSYLVSGGYYYSNEYCRCSTAGGCSGTEYEENEGWESSGVLLLNTTMRRPWSTTEAAARDAERLEAAGGKVAMLPQVGLLSAGEAASPPWSGCMISSSNGDVDTSATAAAVAAAGDAAFATYPPALRSLKVQPYRSSSENFDPTQYCLYSDVVEAGDVGPAGDGEYESDGWSDTYDEYPCAGLVDDECVSGIDTGVGGVHGMGAGLQHGRGWSSSAEGEPGATALGGGSGKVVGNGLGYSPTARAAAAAAAASTLQPGEVRGGAAGSSSGGMHGMAGVATAPGAAGAAGRSYGSDGGGGGSGAAAAMAARGRHDSSRGLGYSRSLSVPASPSRAAAAAGGSSRDTSRSPRNASTSTRPSPRGGSPIWARSLTPTKSRSTSLSPNSGGGLYAAGAGGGGGRDGGSMSSSPVRSRRSSRVSASSSDGALQVKLASHDWYLKQLGEVATAAMANLQQLQQEQLGQQEQQQQGGEQRGQQAEQQLEGQEAAESVSPLTQQQQQQRQMKVKVQVVKEGGTALAAARAAAAGVSPGRVRKYSDALLARARQLLVAETMTPPASIGGTAAAAYAVATISSSSSSGTSTAATAAAAPYGAVAGDSKGSGCPALNLGGRQVSDGRLAILEEEAVFEGSGGNGSCGRRAESSSAVGRGGGSNSMSRDVTPPRQKRRAASASPRRREAGSPAAGGGWGSAGGRGTIGDVDATRLDHLLMLQQKQESTEQEGGLRNGKLLSGMAEEGAAKGGRSGVVAAAAEEVVWVGNEGYFISSSSSTSDAGATMGSVGAAAAAGHEAQILTAHARVQLLRSVSDAMAAGMPLVALADQCRDEGGSYSVAGALGTLGRRMMGVGAAVSEGGGWSGGGGVGTLGRRMIYVTTSDGGIGMSGGRVLEAAVSEGGGGSGGRRVDGGRSSPGMLGKKSLGEGIGRRLPSGIAAALLRRQQQQQVQQEAAMVRQMEQWEEGDARVASQEAAVASLGGGEPYLAGMLPSLLGTAGGVVPVGRGGSCPGVGKRHGGGVVDFGGVGGEELRETGSSVGLGNTYMMLGGWWQPQQQGIEGRRVMSEGGKLTTRRAAAAGSGGGRNSGSGISGLVLRDWNGVGSGAGAGCGGWKALFTAPALMQQGRESYYIPEGECSSLEAIIAKEQEEEVQQEQQEQQQEQEQQQQKQQEQQQEQEQQQQEQHEQQQEQQEQQQEHCRAISALTTADMRLSDTSSSGESQAGVHGASEGYVLNWRTNPAWSAAPLQTADYGHVPHVSAASTAAVVASSGGGGSTSSGAHRGAGALESRDYWQPEPMLPQGWAVDDSEVLYSAERGGILQQQQQRYGSTLGVRPRRGTACSEGGGVSLGGALNSRSTKPMQDGLCKLPVHANLIARAAAAAAAASAVRSESTAGAAPAATFSLKPDAAAAAATPLNTAAAVAAVAGASAEGGGKGSAGGCQDPYGVDGSRSCKQPAAAVTPGMLIQGAAAPSGVIAGRTAGRSSAHAALLSGSEVTRAGGVLANKQAKAAGAAAAGANVGKVRSGETEKSREAIDVWLLHQAVAVLRPDERVVQEEQIQQQELWEYEAQQQQQQQGPWGVQVKREASKQQKDQRFKRPQQQHMTSEGTAAGPLGRLDRSISKELPEAGVGRKSRSSPSPPPAAGGGGGGGVATVRAAAAATAAAVAAIGLLGKAVTGSGRQQQERQQKLQHGLKSEVATAPKAAGGAAGARRGGVTAPTAASAAKAVKPVISSNSPERVRQPQWGVPAVVAAGAVQASAAGGVGARGGRSISTGRTAAAAASGAAVAGGGGGVEGAVGAGRGRRRSVSTSRVASGNVTILTTSSERGLPRRPASAVVTASVWPCAAAGGGGGRGGESGGLVRSRTNSRHSRRTTGVSDALESTCGSPKWTAASATRRSSRSKSKSPGPRGDEQVTPVSPSAAARGADDYGSSAPWAVQSGPAGTGVTSSAFAAAAGAPGFRSSYIRTEGPTMLVAFNRHKSLVHSSRQEKEQTGPGGGGSGYVSSTSVGAGGESWEVGSPKGVKDHSASSRRKSSGKTAAAAGEVAAGAGGRIRARRAAAAAGTADVKMVRRSSGGRRKKKKGHGQAATEVVEGEVSANDEAVSVTGGEESNVGATALPGALNVSPATADKAAPGSAAVVVAGGGGGVGVRDNGGSSKRRFKSPRNFWPEDRESVMQQQEWQEQQQQHNEQDQQGGEGQGIDSNLLCEEEGFGSGKWDELLEFTAGASVAAASDDDYEDYGAPAAADGGGGHDGMTEVLDAAASNDERDSSAEWMRSSAANADAAYWDDGISDAGSGPEGCSGGGDYVDMQGENSVSSSHGSSCSRGISVSSSRVEQEMQGPLPASVEPSGAFRLSDEGYEGDIEEKGAGYSSSTDGAAADRSGGGGAGSSPGGGPEKSSFAPMTAGAWLQLQLREQQQLLQQQHRCNQRVLGGGEFDEDALEVMRGGPGASGSLIGGPLLTIRTTRVMSSYEDGWWGASGAASDGAAGGSAGSSGAAGGQGGVSPAAAVAATAGGGSGEGSRVGSAKLGYVRPGSASSVRGRSPTSRSPRLVGVESPRGLVGVGSPWGMGGSPWGQDSTEGESHGGHDIATVAAASPKGSGGGPKSVGTGVREGSQEGFRTVGESPRVLRRCLLGGSETGVLVQQIGGKEQQQGGQREGEKGREWLESWGACRGSPRVGVGSPAGGKGGGSFHRHQQQLQPQQRLEQQGLGTNGGDWVKAWGGGSPRQPSPRWRQQQQQHQQAGQKQEQDLQQWQEDEEGGVPWDPEWPNSAKGSPHAWQQYQHQQQQQGGYVVGGGAAGEWDPDWPDSARSTGSMRRSSPGSLRAQMVQKQQQLEQEEEEQLRRMKGKGGGGQKQQQQEWWLQEWQQQQQQQGELIKAGRLSGSAGSSPNSRQGMGVSGVSPTHQQQHGMSNGTTNTSRSVASISPTSLASSLHWTRSAVQQREGGTGRVSPLHSGSSSKGLASGSSSVIHSGTRWGSPLRYTPMFDEEGSPRGAAAAVAVGAFPAAALTAPAGMGGSPSAAIVGNGRARGYVGGGGVKLESAGAVLMGTSGNGASVVDSGGGSGRAAASKVVTGLDGIMALVAQLKGSLAGLEHDMQELRSGGASPTVMGEVGGAAW